MSIFLLPLTRQQKISDMQTATGCAEQVAIDYLEAEEWILCDALTSYRVDKQAENADRIMLSRE